GKGPRSVGEGTDQCPGRRVVVRVEARRSGGRVTYRGSGAGERKGVREERVATLRASQSPVAAGENVAAKALIQEKIADPLADVLVGNGAQHLAGVRAQH